MKTEERIVFETGWMPTKAYPDETGGGVETIETSPGLHPYPGSGNLIHMLHEQAAMTCHECPKNKRCSPRWPEIRCVGAMGLKIRIRTSLSKEQLLGVCPLTRTRSRILGRLVSIVEKVPKGLE